jgi:hypothetical protein
MMRVSRCFNHDFGTFKNLFLTVASDVLSQERTMGILEMYVFDGFPNPMYIIWGKRNLKNQ